MQNANFVDQEKKSQEKCNKCKIIEQLFLIRLMKYPKNVRHIYINLVWARIAIFACLYRCIQINKIAVKLTCCLLQNTTESLLLIHGVYVILFIRLVCYCDFYLIHGCTSQREIKEYYSAAGNVGLSQCVNLKNFYWYSKRETGFGFSYF